MGEGHAGEAPLRVLVVHNRYKIAGGEDSCVAGEAAALERAGATVALWEVSNEEIDGPLTQITTAAGVVYSPRARNRLRAEMARFRPSVVHVHNFFPRLSPSVYDASATVPFVQTLHNYRLLCSNALLFRDGSVCEQCLATSVPWPAVRHRCYRGSLRGSLATATMLAVHGWRGTWRTRVARLLVLTAFAKRKVTEHLQIPGERVVVKPNFAEDRGLGAGAGGFALYAGRLSPEKGIGTLLAAAALGLGLPLWVAGEGPMRGEVEQAAARGQVQYVGRQGRAALLGLMQEARVLLLPSLWYEGLPMVIPEAFAAGLPVVASDLGALRSLVEAGENGLLVPPGDPAALALAVRQLLAEPGREARLRRGARLRYERDYKPEPNMARLMAIYRECIAEKQGMVHPRPELAEQEVPA